MKRSKQLTAPSRRIGSSSGRSRARNARGRRCGPPARGSTTAVRPRPTCPTACLHPILAILTAVAIRQESHLCAVSWTLPAQIWQQSTSAPHPNLAVYLSTVPKFGSLPQVLPRRDDMVHRVLRLHARRRSVHPRPGAPSATAIRTFTFTPGGTFTLGSPRVPGHLSSEYPVFQDSSSHLEMHLHTSAQGESSTSGSSCLARRSM